MEVAQQGVFAENMNVRVMFACESELHLAFEVHAAGTTGARLQLPEGCLALADPAGTVQVFGNLGHPSLIVPFAATTLATVR
jgi:hypothetical protein